MYLYWKVLKIAVGSAIAIIIAYALGLDYAVSAGIITLLTLQDTKKETLYVTLMRVVAFFIATIIAFVVFSVFSYHSLLFGVFLLIFAGICYFFKTYDAIAMNAVLVTHYLLEEEISLATIGNEAGLLLVGAGIGILLNLYIPNNIKQIHRKQRIIEEDLRIILSQMAEILMVQNKSEYNSKSLESLREHITIGVKQAYTNMNNSLFQETRYYIEYMEMRKQQYSILEEIYDKIKSLTTVSIQTNKVADFIMTISNTLSETQNAKELLYFEDNLLLEFKNSPLPLTRDEFENRAVLYVILMDIRIFLKIKEEFADSLTEEQLNKYWKRY